MSQRDKINFGIKYENPVEFKETKPSVKIKVESGKFDDIKSSNKKLTRGIMLHVTNYPW